MKIVEIYEKVIKEFLRHDGIAGIFLIGRGAKVPKEDFYSLNDIDILVVYDNENHFMRKVEVIDGVLFDISYISMGTIRELIDNRVPRWITVIGNCKAEGVYNTKLKDMIDETVKLYEDGTQALTKEEIEVERFLISTKYEDIVNRIENKPEAMFLIDLLVKRITQTYFHLKGLWPCPDKKILHVIEKVDKEASNYCNRIILERDVEKKVGILKDYILYVLEPYGGMSATLEKRKFPMYTQCE